MKRCQPIGFAVAGVGAIGSRHADLLNRHKGARLVAVCDPVSPGGLHIPPGAVYYPNLEALLCHEPLVEAVHICTPNGLHAALALEALDAKKHVVIEKPMTLFAHEARQIVGKAREVNREVFVVKQNRFSPAMQWLRQMLVKAQLGEVYLVQISCFWNRDWRYYSGHNWRGTARLDGGPLFTQFSHFVDMLLWLFGPAQPEHAQFRDFNHHGITDFEDSGSVLLRLRNGALATLTYSTSVWDCNLESSLTVMGSKGSVKISGQYMNELSVCHIEGVEPPVLDPANPPNVYEGYAGSAANHAQMIDHVIRVLNGEAENGFTAPEACAVIELIEQIYALRPAKQELASATNSKKQP